MTAETNTTTIAAAGVPKDLVEWLDRKAKAACTSRSTIMRQILAQKVAEESQEADQQEAAA